MIKRILLYLLISLTLIFYGGSTPAKDMDLYSHLYSQEIFNKYRQIKYWANLSISIQDYNVRSGDAEYLNLSKTDVKKPLTTIPSKPIVDHFKHEFNRLIKGNIPFHDTEEGRNERFHEYLLNNKKLDFDGVDKFEALEEARRNSLYGSNPGIVYCHISISRRKFPILYEIRTGIIPSKDFYSRLVEERNLGFSTPEHIDGELKRAITDHLEKLSRKLNDIRKALKKQK